MLRKVVVATDLSGGSIAFLRRLRGLRNYGTEKCILLLCLGVQETASVAFSYSVHRLEESLQYQKDILRRQGYSVEARTVTGDLIGEINRTAIDEGCSAIAVGARARAMISDFFFSGIADDVIHHAQKPVLVIRLEDEFVKGGAGAEAVESDLCSHVLFPTDFSDNAGVAFDYVIGLATRGARKITLVHIQDKARISPHLDDRLGEFNKIDDKRLQSMKSIIQRESKAEVETVIRYGSPVVEIIKLVSERDVKLVVMGNQGRGFVQELFLGSVSNNIARLSPSSVLLIPMPR